MAGQTGISIDGGPGVTWAAGYLNPLQPLGFGTPYDLWYWDGATSTQVASLITGFSVGDDGNLYVITGGWHIQRAVPPSLALEDVVPIGQAGSETNTSLCVLPGSTQAVVGTSDSRLKLVDLS